ncbi:hypothetical protein [Pseudomonas sp. YL-218 TE3947]|uniref:hypothetical protein n=1 Tax=Pseudomonas TaxID=286 RepID=UPI003D1C8D08
MLSKHTGMVLTFLLTVLLGYTPLAQNAAQYTPIQQQTEFRLALVHQSQAIDTSISDALALAREARVLAEQLCISSVGAANCQR